MKLKSLLTSVGIAVATLPSQNVLAVGNDLPEHTETSAVSDNLSSVGSDTLANMITFWADEFKHTYPSVNIQIQAAGSSAASPVLTVSTSGLRPMSRKCKGKSDIDRCDALGLAGDWTGKHIQLYGRYAVLSFISS